MPYVFVFQIKKTQSVWRMGLHIHLFTWISSLNYVDAELSYHLNWDFAIIRYFKSRETRPIKEGTNNRAYLQQFWLAWFNVFYDFNFSISDKRFVSFFCNSTINVQYYEIRNLLQSSCSDIVTRSASCPPYPHSAHRVKKTYPKRLLFSSMFILRTQHLQEISNHDTSLREYSHLWILAPRRLGRFRGEDKSMIPAVRRLGMREGCILAQARLCTLFTSKAYR